MLLGVAMMVAEAFAPSFGALGVGGVVAFVVGALFLFDGDVPGFALSWPVVPARRSSPGAVRRSRSLRWRSHRRPVATGDERAVGSAGEVVELGRPGRRMRVNGERWRGARPAPSRAGQTRAHGRGARSDAA